MAALASPCQPLGKKETVVRHSEEIRKSAYLRAVIGIVVAVAGGLIIESGAASEDFALGIVLVAIGQFLFLQGLITWCVARGSEPLLAQLVLIRELSHESLSRDAVAPATGVTQVAPGAPPI
jgi:hypothetical protein